MRNTVPRLELWSRFQCRTEWILEKIHWIFHEQQIGKGSWVSERRPWLLVLNCTGRLWIMKYGHRMFTRFGTKRITTKLNLVWNFGGYVEWYRLKTKLKPGLNCQIILSRTRLHSGRGTASFFLHWPHALQFTVVDKASKWRKLSL